MDRERYALGLGKISEGNVRIGADSDGRLFVMHGKSLMNGRNK